MIAGRCVRAANAEELNAGCARLVEIPAIFSGFSTRLGKAPRPRNLT
jgi:hypothetical protein